MDDREQTLHGPWPGASDQEQAALLTAFGDQWRIWRGLTEHREPSGWHAARDHDLPPEIAGRLGLVYVLSADTAEDLRAALVEQEARFDAAIRAASSSTSPSMDAGHAHSAEGVPPSLPAG